MFIAAEAHGEKNTDSGSISQGSRKAINSMKFSERTSWLLETNLLTRLLEERRAASLPVLDLTESNPTRCGFDYSSAPLSALANPDGLNYRPDPRGLLSAREAVAKYYAGNGIRVDPDNVFLTSSTSEAYAFVFRLLGNPGDDVLLPCPGYPLFDFLARLNDLNRIAYPLVYDGRWSIDREALSSAITARSRAIVVVHPVNPTGSFATSTEAAFLAEIAGRRELAIIADEVFYDYAHPGAAPERASSFAAGSEALTFTLNGLSKISALPQMKCAWLVLSGDTGLVQAAAARLEVIADTYLSLSTPVAVALPELLEFRKTIQPQLRARIAQNLAALDAALAPDSPAERLRVEGGWYAVLRLPRTLTDEEWALRLLLEDGVLVHPGHFYDFPLDGHIVVSLLPQPDVFGDAAAKIAARVR